MNLIPAEDRYVYVVYSKGDPDAKLLLDVLEKHHLNVKSRHDCWNIDHNELEASIQETIQKAKLIVVFASVATLDEATRTFPANQKNLPIYENERLARFEREYLIKLSPNNLYVVLNPNESSVLLNGHTFFNDLNVDPSRWVACDDAVLGRRPFTLCINGGLASYFLGQNSLLGRDFSNAFMHVTDALLEDERNPVFKALFNLASENKSGGVQGDLSSFFETLGFSNDLLFTRYNGDYTPFREQIVDSVDRILGADSRDSWIEKTVEANRKKNADEKIVGRLYDYFCSSRALSVSNLIDLWNGFPQEIGGEPLPGALLNLKMFGVRWSFRYVPRLAYSRDVIDCNDDKHTVESCEGFWFAEVPTTIQQWSAVVRKKIDYDRRRLFLRVDSDDQLVADVPIANVSYDKCQEIVQAMRRVGLRFFIPNSNEWLRACLADTDELVDPVNLSNFAWTPDNWSHAGLPKVRQLRGNRLGLYDMIGGVWEITSTTSLIRNENETFECVTLRGGSCRTNDCSPFSVKCYPDQGVGFHDVGFRVAFRHSDLKRALGFDLIENDPRLKEMEAALQ